MKFNFLIPLKTTKVFDNSNWSEDKEKHELIKENLVRTLISIEGAASQVSDKVEVNVFVSGHENPLTDMEKIWSYINIVFVGNDFPRPTEKSLYMNDKELKKTSAIKELKKTMEQNKEESSIVMLLDADDLVATDFFHTVLSTFEEQNCDDIAMMSGYLCDKNNQAFGYLNGIDRIFYRNCGSSFISKVKLEDLEIGGFVSRLRNHVRFHEQAKDASRNVYYSFEPTVLYLVNHGENDVSERHGEHHMINFVKQYLCSVEQISQVKEKFPSLVL